MWKCPTCNRQFKLVDQWHSCYVMNVDYHFRNKSEEIRSLYDHLVKHMKAFGPFQIIAVKSAILFKSGSNFVSVRIKKKNIDLEFQLARAIDEYPITVVARVSKNRVVHATSIDDEEQVTECLIEFLKESYDLISKG